MFMWIVKNLQNTDVNNFENIYENSKQWEFENTGYL